MVAPTPSVRVVPTSWKIDQGYRITITNSADTDVSLFEVEVTPGGLDNGDPIDTSTQFNNKYHTRRPRALMKADGAKIKAQLAAGTRKQVDLLIGVEATITETYPDGSTYCYYGYFKSVKFDTFKEGEKPMCEVEVVETDWDYVNSVEAGAVFTAIAGTANAT